MPNRKKAPIIQDISNLRLPNTQKISLDNGIPVYILNMGTQDILKLEMVFYAGRPFENKKLLGRATARLLKEGTPQYNSQEIAEKIDFYGGTLTTPVNLDTSSIVLYSLKKHFEKLLTLVNQLLYHPTFPEKELNNYIRNSKQNLQVDLSKNDVLAYRQITELIFGAQHPYGYNSVFETYDNLNREDLQAHHQKHYTAENCVFFLSGKVDESVILLLNQYLGQSQLAGKSSPKSLPYIHKAPEQIKIDKKDSVQTAIRIGRRLFSRRHPDYQAMFILNTILGGYFSSRLMANIREDKGYTYNIFSSLDTMRYDGYFMVGTEVGNEYVDATIKEIYKEFELLQQEPIDAEELAMVQNYMLGNLMTMLDGPMNVSEVIRTLVLDDLPFEEFGNLVQLIKQISPKQIQTLAQKYLDKNAMWEVIVGA